MAGVHVIVWSGLGKTVGRHRSFAGDRASSWRCCWCCSCPGSSSAPTPSRVDSIFRQVQFVSASLYSLGHGGNDAQKTMGIIAALLFAHGALGGTFHVPFWVVMACQAAMALGTLFGGWRIVRTMGSRITRLTPLQGVCAETAGSITLFLATCLGIPVSTTHTITGAIVGVGAARRTSAVRWNVAKDIVMAWIVTMPAAGRSAPCFTLRSRRLGDMSVASAVLLQSKSKVQHAICGAALAR